MKMKWAVFLAFILSLAVTASVWLLTSFDPNYFKLQIENAVFTATGYQLDLEGDLKLTFIPRLGLEVTSARLHNIPGFTQHPIAEIDYLFIGVTLIPLARGIVNVEQVYIEGVFIDLQVDANGRTNAQNLIALFEKSESDSVALSVVPPFIKGIEIQNASVRLTNIQSGGVIDIIPLHVSTGPFIPGKPLDLGIGFSLNNAGAQDVTNIGLTGRVTYDPETKYFSLEGTQFNLIINNLGSSQQKAVAALNFNVVWDINQAELRLTDVDGELRCKFLEDYLFEFKATSVIKFDVESYTKEEQLLNSKVKEPQRANLHAIAEIDINIVEAIQTQRPNNQAMNTHLNIHMEGSAYDMGEKNLTVADIQVNYLAEGGGLGDKEFGGTLSSMIEGNIWENEYKIPSLILEIHGEDQQGLMGDLRLATGGAFDLEQSRLDLNDVTMDFLVDRHLLGGYDIKGHLETTVEADITRGRIKIAPIYLKIFDIDMQGGIEVNEPLEDLSAEGYIKIKPFSPRKLLEDTYILVPDNLSLNRLRAASALANFYYRRDRAFSKFLIFIDETKMKGNIHISGFRRPDIDIDLDVDTLSLDSYLPGLSSFKKQTAQSSMGPLHSALEASKNMVIKSSVRASNLSIADLHTEEITATTSVSNGKLAINKVRVRLYGGVIDGAFTASVRQPETKYTIRMDATNMRVGDLLRDVLHNDEVPIDGNMSAKIRLTSQGVSRDRLTSTLNGHIDLAATNGILYQGPLFDSIERLQLFLQGRPFHPSEKHLSISSMSSNWKIDRGIMSNYDLMIDASQFELYGEGTIDLNSGEVDYQLTPALPMGVRDIFIVPIDITGTLDNIHYGLNFGKEQKLIQ